MIATERGSRTDALLALLTAAVETYRADLDHDGTVRRLEVAVKFSEPSAWPHLPQVTFVKAPRVGP